MNTKEFIKSQTFRGILIGLVLAILTLVVFQAGVVVGERRAGFAHRFGDSFERNFRNPEGEGRMMLRGFPGGKQFPGGHGVAGEVISIALPDIVVAEPDNLEKTILIDGHTVIRKFQNQLGEKDLVIGDHVIAIGEPNDEGKVVARLIRVVPQNLSQ